MTSRKEPKKCRGRNGYRFTVTGFALFFLFAMAACSPRHLAVDQMIQMIQTGMPALEQDDDLDLVQRAIPGQIKLLEIMRANRPDQPELLVLLARLYGSLAFAFGEEQIEAGRLGISAPERVPGARGPKERVDSYYQKGMAYALEALAVSHPDCGKQLKTIAGATEFFLGLEPPDVPALFWYAFNLGGHVNLNRDSIRVLAQAHLAEKAAKRVIDLNPAYFNGGAHLLLMVYYASRPPMMGGNPAAARDQYQKLESVAGSDFLLARVLYGRFCLVQAGDKEGFQQTMDAVIRSNDGPAQYRLYNAVARQRARLYLDAQDRFFQ